MSVYYNEIEPFAIAWLKELMAQNVIPQGEIDTRPIQEVTANDIRGFTQCHFFAGIGGWAEALQLAGWPTDRPVWTGSCPCQPFSTAGKRKGKADERHLWPHWYGLIRECRPSIVFGEQVASAITQGWLDSVYDDLEAEGYACGASVLPACSVGAPHKRDRLWFVGYSGFESPRDEEFGLSPEWQHGGKKAVRAEKGHRFTDPSTLGNAEYNRPYGASFTGSNESTVQHIEKGHDSACKSAGAGNTRYVADSNTERSQREWPHSDAIRWEGQNMGPLGLCDRTGLTWIQCPDGKSRPVKPGIRLLANGIPNRVGILRGFGNAIVPQVAAEFIKASQHGS